MLKIVPYEARYDRALLRQDAASFREIRELPDVIPESRILCFNKNALAGVGWISAGASFLSLREDLPEYHLHLHFYASGSKEAEVSELLLKNLTEYFSTFSLKYSGKRLILRTWIRSAHTAYLELLNSLGFRPMRTMEVLEKELSEMENTAEDRDPLEFPNDPEIRFTRLDFTDEAIREAYIRSSRAAFGIFDSIEELLFRVRCGEASVYAFIRDREILSSLTVWPLSASVTAVENIFTHPDWRKNGLASCLIRKVLKIREEEGYRRAQLTVFGDDLPAVSLYLKLGFSVSDVLLEMHYETDYRPSWY